MSQRRVQIVILCEDRQQEVFARHFLKKRGFKGLFRPKICNYNGYCYFYKIKVFLEESMTGGQPVPQENYSFNLLITLITSPIPSSALIVSPNWAAFCRIV